MRPFADQKSFAPLPKESPLPQPISTWAVLLDLGFAEDPSQQMRGYSFDFGTFKLWALPCTNRWFVKIVLVTGVLFDGNNLTEVQDELPAAVESVEQAKAWIAQSVDNAIGRRFVIGIEPGWLREGRLHRHLLPMERKRAAWLAEQAERALTRCYIDRDWMRVGLKKLRERLTAIDDGTPILFAFDGSLLMIRCGLEAVVIPGEGPRWPEAYSISAVSLRELPKRLLGRSIEVSIWKSVLTINRCRYEGAEPAGRGL